MTSVTSAGVRPALLRKLARGTRDVKAQLVGQFCRWPDFLIIGAAKAGTSALYWYLCRRPDVLPARTAEVHYFDLHFDKGHRWYRSHFPRTQPFAASGTLTGEASPYYLFHPLVPQRVARTLPEVRLIAMLRNPVDRAYSHWAHRHRQGLETMPFEGALSREKNVLEQATRTLLTKPHTTSPAHRSSSYLARGLYLDQLQRWERHVPLDRTLIVVSERLFAEPASMLPAIHRHLGIGAPEPGDFSPANVGRYEQMAPATRAQLADYFRKPNQQLADYLGFDPGWE